ncbi:polysaccharide deacetylase [Thomasclavelia sp.]|uniref:polysaccharide deacetylase n=1 Tax=Thomasclavelia sp. TaxID=3025757 RepID=UPI0026182BFF|nr:polysaccharide deacetylase [Thomasclavelia sp.]
MNLKFKNITVKKKVTLVVVLLVLIVSIIVCYFMFRCPIVFKQENIKVEINEEFDALKNIEKVKNGNIKDIKVNTKQVKFNKLGKYKVIYTFNDKNYELPLEIVDTKKPKFDIVDLDIDLGMKVNAKDMVTNIDDATKTKVKFKKNYKFDHEGKTNVIVQVIDEAGNVSEKKGKVKLFKDDIAPKISGIEEITIAKGGKIDYKLGISVSDNRDPNPKLSINSSKVDVNKLGEYKAIYTVQDRSGNKVVKERLVKVVEKKEIGTLQQNNEKIVYLTFDDGPSENTQKILDILDRYNIKATFFVTGVNQKYNYLIQDAYKRGHTIGLHTYCHDYGTVYASVDAYFDDLNKVGNMVKDLIGYVPRYIRFPGGASNTVSRKYSQGIMTALSKEVINRGYQYYDWNGDSTDASGNNVPVSKLIANATSSKANNINILFHDTKAKSTTVDALPTIIENYLARGYRFEAISDNAFVPHQGINN